MSERGRSRSGRPRVDGLIQIGIVVESISASVRSYTDLLGIDDWHYLEVDSADTDAEFTVDGDPVPVHVLTAWTRVDQMEIELIEPRDTTSLYADFLRERGPGVHHVLLKTDDWESDTRAMRDAGVKSMVAGRLQQSRFALFDTAQALGMVCEFADGPPLVPDATEGADQGPD